MYYMYYMSCHMVCIIWYMIGVMLIKHNELLCIINKYNKYKYNKSN